MQISVFSELSEMVQGVPAMQSIHRRPIDFEGRRNLYFGDAKASIAISETFFALMLAHDRRMANVVADANVTSDHFPIRIIDKPVVKERPHRPATGDAQPGSGSIRDDDLPQLFLQESIERPRQDLELPGAWANSSRVGTGLDQAIGSVEIDPRSPDGKSTSRISTSRKVYSSRSGCHQVG